MPMSHLWQAWICADGSKKGNSLELVLILEVVRSSRHLSRAAPDLASGTSLGLG